MSVRCPACGRPDGRSWRSARASDPGLAGRERYPLLRCATCGSAWVPREERPADPSPLYSGGTYGRPSDRIDRVLGPLRRLADRERFAVLRGLPKEARILELGSGDGRFVAELRRRNYEANGTDAFPRGDEVDAGAAEALESPAAGYDAVVAWHVLEHLDDPEEAVRRARAALVPGGRLVVATPNLASLQARLGGDRWFHQDVPRHTILFTAAGLRALLLRCGFRAVSIRHLGGQQNLLGMWQTLVNRVTRDTDVAFRTVKGAGRARAADVALSAAGGLAALPLTLVLEPVASLAGHGGAIVAIATIEAA